MNMLASDLKDHSTGNCWTIRMPSCHFTRTFSIFESVVCTRWFQIEVACFNSVIPNITRIIFSWSTLCMDLTYCATKNDPLHEIVKACDEECLQSRRCMNKVTRWPLCCHIVDQYLLCCGPLLLTVRHFVSALFEWCVFQRTIVVSFFRLDIMNKYV